jgi:hypothetical protein
MRLMNHILCPYLDSFVIFYLDDILVYSATSEEHIKYHMQVLETLKNLTSRNVSFLSNL